MARKLTNDFSWSRSRHEKLTECLRAYYFQYYASWGGWEREAPEHARTLYILKKLGNRYTWAGGVVHDAIKDALLDVRTGKTPDVATAISRAQRLMRGDYVHSRAKGYWRSKHRKEFAGLIEHEYDDGTPDEAWKKNWENVEAALRWFFASHWIDTARALKPEQWLEVDAGFEHSQFVLEGVKVFAIPDFAYLDDAGNPVVVDWKTGKAREGYDEQVLGYALYLATRYRHPVENVSAKLVYLNEGLEQTVQVDPEAIASFKGHFQQSVDQMRSLLVDAANNLPKEEDAFPMTERLESCARCNFRRICGREDVAVKVA